MSGVMMVQAGMTSNGLVSGASWSPHNTAPSTGQRSASLTFNSDGSVTSTNQAFTPDWYSPNVTGIGSNFSVKIVISSSTATNVTGMTSGTWYSLSTGRTITFVNTGSNTEGFGSGSVYFSRDGGATSSTGGTLDWDVGYIA